MWNVASFARLRVGCIRCASNRAVIVLLSSSGLGSQLHFRYAECHLLYHCCSAPGRRFNFRHRLDFRPANFRRCAGPLKCAWSSRHGRCFRCGHSLRHRFRRVIRIDAKTCPLFRRRFHKRWPRSDRCQCNLRRHIFCHLRRNPTSVSFMMRWRLCCW